MREVLVYVDAENITKEQFTEINKKLNSDSECWVKGKVYGNAKVLGEILSECLEAGYEYVDTQAVVDTNKNVTDMKIVVDCITDVMSAPRGSIDEVYILSADHDFIPLVRKLKAQRVTVITPFLQDSESGVTCTDLNIYLKESKFDPVMQKVLLRAPFELFRSVAPQQFSDAIVDRYVSSKKYKFRKELMKNGMQDLADGVDCLDTEDFSFQRLTEQCNVVDLEKKVSVFDMYTRKMFGISLRHSEAVQQMLTI